MALQTSGAISLSNIANEFGGSAPHSLSEYYGAAAGIPSSGTISFNQFYGKSNIPPLGGAGAGGYNICCSSGTAWIVAPSSTEVYTSWYNKETAITNANNNAPCGDWFIPTCGQLKDPGYKCRTYWDSYTSSLYWSTTGSNIGPGYATRVSMVVGGGGDHGKGQYNYVRAFRTVTY